MVTSRRTPPCVPSQESRDDQVLSLPDLVRISKQFPLTVRVKEGYCGSEER